MQRAGGQLPDHNPENAGTYGRTDRGMDPCRGFYRRRSHQPLLYFPGQLSETERRLYETSGPWRTQGFRCFRAGPGFCGPPVERKLLQGRSSGRRWLLRGRNGKTDSGYFFFGCIPGRNAQKYSGGFRNALSGRLEFRIGPSPPLLYTGNRQPVWNGAFLYL